MENTPNLRLSVSDFIALTNQTLEYAYPSVEVEGEVAGFKVNQGKYVFFDLKDQGASIGCFMTVWQLRTPARPVLRKQPAAPAALQARPARNWPARLPSSRSRPP